MSQYRLIQEYPNNDLPLDARVVEKRIGRYVIYESLNAPLGYFPQKEVEDNPKFWEKVEEKDFEILMLIHKDKGIPYTINELWHRYSLNFNSKDDLIRSLSTGNYNIRSIKRLNDKQIFKIHDLVKFSAEHSHLDVSSRIKSFELKDNKIYVYNYGCLKAGLGSIKHKEQKDFEILTRYGAIKGDLNPVNSPIASVQRLRDGEVFKVDDKVLLPDDKVVTIEKIEIDEGYIKLYYKKSGFATACVSNEKESGNWFDKIKKVEKLFTTEDGVDLYKGDRFFSVDLVDFKFDDRDRPLNYDTFVKDPRIKYFSTKESAENYIENNKPCFSLQDIKDAFDGTYKYLLTETELINKLKNK